VAQNNYKVAQKLQSGARITKWRITHGPRVYISNVKEPYLTARSFSNL